MKKFEKSSAFIRLVDTAFSFLRFFYSLFAISSSITFTDTSAIPVEAILTFSITDKILPIPIPNPHTGFVDSHRFQKNGADMLSTFSNINKNERELPFDVKFIYTEEPRNSAFQGYS